MHTHQTLSIAGHTLAVLPLNPAATGETIILLHGFSHSIGGWCSDTTFQALGRGYALSLPGHYPAAFPPGFTRQQLTTELIAELLAKAIARIAGDQPVTLVGFSTGGYAALALAALYPAQIKRVICIAGFAQGLWGGPIGDWQRRARGSWLQRTWLGMQFHVLKHISLTMFINGPIWQQSAGDTPNISANPLLRPYAAGLHRYFSGVRPAALLQYCQAMAEIDITAMLPAIRLPMLVMFGSRDPIVPAQQGRLIANTVQNATLAELVGAGHLVMLERPNEYSQIIQSWMKESRRDLR
jgi:pimeloyl-ACP methyl ester carboxylesterase